MDKVMKIMFWAMGILFIVGMGIQLTSAAEPTYQYVKQYMDPLYRQSMEGAVQYDYNLHIDTPDGITEVVSAMITMQLWLNPTIEFEVLVDGLHCNNPTYEVHTTYAGAGEGTIYFDCSNIITGEGDYVVSMIPDDSTGASTFWIDLTYSNAPKGTVEVHGTEYAPGDRAKLWVQLLNSSGDDVIDGACQVDIYTPVNTILIENGAMTNMEHDGIYYYDLIAPQSHGVYPAIAKCYYDVTSTSEYADSFTSIVGVPESVDYTKTWALDGDEQKLKQLLGSIEFTYDIDNMCGLTTNELLLTGVAVSVNAKWTDSVTNDNIVISVYNFTSSSWINLPNQIIDPNDRLTVSNFISTNNITRAGLVDGSGTLRVHFNDTLKGVGADKKIEMDFLEVTCEEFANPEWTEIKGSSEMHISGEYKWIAQVESGQIFNDSWPGEFHYNVTLSSRTAQTEENEHIFIELPTPFPCHHVQNLSIDGVNTPFEPHDPMNPDTSGCSVEWDQSLNVSTNYDIQIVSESWFKEKETTWIARAQTEYGIISGLCIGLKNLKGLDEYVIPMTSQMNYSYDADWNACQQYFDQYYHFNNTYFNEFQTPAGIFTEADMDALNEMWRHLDGVTIDLDSLATAIMNKIQTSHDYSAIINQSGVDDFWSGYSSSWYNYELLIGLTEGDYIMPVNETSISNSIWNYSDRQLTTFDFTVIVNTTAIANAVWTSPIRTLTGLVGLNATALSDIWSYAIRGLTEQVDVDWATGSNYVWNDTISPARYTHGTQLS